MPPNSIFNPQNETPTLFTSKFIIVSFSIAVFSGFVFAPAVPAYLRSVEALLYGRPLYGNLSTVYPPFWYGVLSIIFGPLEFFGIPILSPSYFSILWVKLYLIGSIVAAVYVLIRRKVVDTRFAYVVIFNPVVFITTVVMGQAEGPIVLGLCLALLGWKVDRWELVGAGISLGAAMKFYPVLLFAPAIFRRIDKVDKIFYGALPVSVFTLGLWIGKLPNSLNMIGGQPNWVTNMAVLGWATLLGFDAAGPMKWIFFVSVLLCLLWSMFGQFEQPETALVIPLLPTMYLYNRITAYHWVPLIVAITYLLYQYQGQSQRILKRYLIVLTGVGTVYQSITFGLYALTDNPVIESTVFPTSLSWFTRESLPYVTAWDWGQVLLMVINITVAMWAWYNLTTGFSIPKPIQDIMNHYIN